MDNYFIIFAIISCILSVFSVGLALYACILAKSLERATHTVQMVPISENQATTFTNEEELQKVNEEQKDDNDNFFRMV